MILRDIDGAHEGGFVIVEGKIYIDRQIDRWRDKMKTKKVRYHTNGSPCSGLDS